ncbi:MAG: DUF4249 domain-containing protein [Saprospiraceae bacterium]
MVRAIKLFISILLPFLLLGCGEDFFDSVTEIEIPEHEPQLVVRANFNATYGKEYGYYVRLNHTLGILDTTEYQEVDDATVTLFEAGELKASFEKPVDDSYWYRTDKMELVANKNYTLSVNSPTYGSAEATRQLPRKIPIIAATYEADGAVDRYGDRGDEVTIQFQDFAGEQNYYTIQIVATYTFEGLDTSFVIDNFLIDYLSPVDPLLDDLDQLYLTDVSFDGEIYTTRVSLNLMEAGSIEYAGAKNLAAEKIDVQLISISKDEYLFEKTLSAYRDNDGNPFAEPVVIHENIEGGSGIFTLSVTDVFSIDL